MLPPESPLELLDLPVCHTAGVFLYCKRDDRYAYRAGSPLQGNKVRKLAPLLANPRAVASMGGNYSNHVAALAAAGRKFVFPVHLFIRGEAVSNPVLDFARAQGAKLQFVSRSDYRERRFPNLGLEVIPEGGTTRESLPYTGQAYAATVAQLGAPPDYFCLSAGTGGTAAGIIIAAARSDTTVEVYPALKGDWMWKEITRFTPAPFNLISNYHFGGYAKFPRNWKLSRPPGQLASRAGIGVAGLPPLEPVYTAKLFSGVLDRIAKGLYARGSTVVIYHSGGIY